MNPNPRTVFLRATERSLRLLVRLWPQESREWAAAMAAEAGEIEHSSAALSWLLGGISFFLRSLLSYFLAWMRLPAGVGSPVGSLPARDPQHPSPRHSRLLTAALLAAAVALLLLPQGHEALVGVRASWSNSEMPRADKDAIERLAQRASREKDPRGLAFAAISYPESPKAEDWAKQAVALDPSFFWIDGWYRANDIRVTLPDARSQELATHDPDNSFVYLLGADQIYRTRISSLYEISAPPPAQIERLLSEDPRWLAWMQKALQASRYESYSEKRRALQREIWSANRYLSPDLVMRPIQTEPFLDTGNLIAFVTLRVQQAKQFQTAGNTSEAERSLKELLSLADRMADASHDNVAAWGALQVRRKSLPVLKDLCLSMGQAQNALAVSAQIEQLNHWQASDVRSYRRVFEWSIYKFRWIAACVQCSALALLLFAANSALSLLFLELSPIVFHKPSSIGRRFACIAADYAPLVLLASSAALLLSYGPYSRLYDGFRAGRLATADQWTFAFGYDSLHSASPGNLFSAMNYEGWLLLVILLSLLAIYILVRGFRKSKPAA